MKNNTDALLKRCFAPALFTLFVLFAVLLLAPSANAMTDREEMELADAGKLSSKNTKAKSSGYATKPQPSDTLFLNGWSPTIGKYLGYGSEISIPINIERYFGNKQKLIASGALPDHADLTLYAWDVDEDTSPGRPEVDNVYFNGNYIGTLSGHDDKWKENTFKVPIELVNLPTSENTKAENVIRIEIDTYTKNDWLVQIDWASLSIPAAPPVVISHGIRNSASDVSDLAAEIEKLGLPTHTFSYREHGNSSIRDGGRQLATEIEKAANKWHVDRVTIVGHSMGGLKAREYISSFDPTGFRVDRVIQIATPNRGSYLAAAQQWLEANIDSAPSSVRNAIKTLMWLGNFEGPAFYDLLPSSMVEYNKGHPLSENVDYTVIAGNCGHADWSIDSLLFGDALRMIEYGQGDTVVSVSSAHTLVPPHKHSPINSPYATHSGLVSNPGLLTRGMASVTVAYLREDLLRPKSSQKRYLRSERTKRAVSVRKNEMPGDDGATDNSPAYFLFGTQKQSSGTSLIPFVIRKNTPTRLCYYIEEEDLQSFSLLSPSGVIYSESSKDVFIGDLGFCRTVIIAAPEPGTWNVRFQTSGVAQRSWALMVQGADSGIDLNPTLANEKIHIGNTFSLSMRPKVDGASQTGVSCSVVVQNPDNTSATYSLRHTGGGVYVTSIPANIEGRYSIVAQATISGTTYSCSLSGTAHSSPATIGADWGSGPVDEDGDGMYDWLVAKVGIASADASKTYRVLAELVDVNGEHIEWASGTAEAGENYAELYFNGSLIFEHGKTAKYVITDVRLFEMGDAWEVQTDARSNWLQLDGNTWATFTHQLVSVAGTGSNSIVWPTGSQTGNLSVGLDVNFDVAIAGTYNYSASLRASDGTLLSSAYGTTSLSSSVSEGIGTQRVSMTFSGADIIAAGKAGPWVVTDVLLWNSSNELSAEGEYETRAWSVGEFKTTTLSKLTISGPASVVSGKSATYTCTASYSDGTSKRVSPTWTLYSGGTYGRITSGGVFEACETFVQRSVTIQATFGGKSAWKTVAVVPPTEQIVSFDRGDGTTAAAKRTYKVGQAYGSLPKATLAGHALLGWFTHREGGVQVLETDIVPPWTPRTLFAHWTTEQKAAFNANGGSCSTVSLTATIGGVYPALPTPSKTGYAFAGWYTTAGGGSLVQSGDTVTATSTRTLYAHWTTKQKVIFDGVGGTPAVACRTNTIGNTYGKFPAATLAGQALLGWFTHRVGGTQVLPTDIVPPWTPRTLFAHWTTEQKATFNANGGSCSTASLTATIGGAYPALPTPSKTGYAFAGWYTKASGGTLVQAGDTVTATASRTLYAHWTKKQKVIFDGVGGEPAVACRTNTIGGAYGKFPTATLSGQALLGWFTHRVGGTQVLPTDIVPEWTPRTLFAHWTTEQTVVFDANGGTTPETQRKRTIGTTYGTLPAATRPGYALLGWYTKASGGSAVAAGATVTAVATRTLYAHWTDRQVTTFKGNGGTPSTQKTTNTIYATYGAMPTAQLSGHVFLGWFNAAEGGKQVYTDSTVTLAAERTLYAHWTDQQVVTFKGNGGTPSAQKTTNTIYAKYGAFPSVSWANHVFLGWYTAASEGDGKRVYTNSTVTLAGTRTLWAQWTDKQVVTFRGNGGSPDVQRHTNTMGKAYGTLPEPKRSGQVFQGWFTAEEGGTQVKGTDKATAATARTLWAHWTDRQVTVFKGNGGTPKTQRMTNTIYAAYGELPTATLSGHVLTGWYTAAEGGKRVYTNSTVTLAAERTLYAHWSDRQVVTFKGNGGTPSAQKTTNTIYAKYGAFPSVSWANHVFLGWYTAASEGDGKRVYTNSTVTLAGTRTLWAQWTDKQVVTFRGNGGLPDVQRLTNTMGKAYGTLPEPKRSGHVFQGWFTAEEGGTQVKGADKATAATARTLYAHWTDKQVVTFKGNGGTPSTQKTTNTIYAAYGTLPSATRSGQVLEGWYTAADGGKRVYTNSTVTLAAARTLYAHWTDQQVVTFKGNGGRPGTQKTTNTIYAKYGAFPSVEWSGHVFQGWYNAAEGGKRVYTNSTVTLAATRTLYAHWTTGKGFAITAIAVGAGDGEDGPSPRAVRGEDRGENVCRLRFELSAGTEYEIQWTPSMAAEWETVERLTAETDGEVEVEIEVPGGEKGFFRLVVFDDGREED